jgi:hypothetical protein
MTAQMSAGAPFPACFRKLYARQDMFRPRTLTAFGVVSCFLLYILLAGVEDSLSSVLGFLLNLPDFSKYNALRTLSRHEFPIDDPSRRVIIVGDIHGMIEPLQKLLHKVDYIPSRDVLVTVGDVVAKAPLKDSLDVLELLSRHNATGVRGNHDQKVIEWRGWLNWATSLPGGERWLKHLEEKWSVAIKRDPHIDLEVWLQKERKAGEAKEWWKLVPKGWVPLGDHYQIAKNMSEAQYRYLLQLPLRLYVPHVHAFIVHAGLLAADPRYPLSDERRQPLARIPKLKTHVSDVEKLRQLQELSLLSQIPQNADPWVTLNMRSILKGKVLKGKKGRYWTEVWQEQMDKCAGFKNNGLAMNRDLEESTKHDKLPCYPISAIYGHTASKGLDIHRWTFGLDSGCIYGRSLSALVIGGENALEADLEDSKREGNADGITFRKKLQHSPFKFSDNLEARVVSVDC